MKPSPSRLRAATIAVQSALYVYIVIELFIATSIFVVGSGSRISGGNLKFAGIILAGLTWLTWQSTVENSLRDLPKRGILKVGPGVVWWFVPLLNLFLPYFVIRQTWHLAHSLGSNQESVARIWEPVPRWLILWWLLFAGIFIIPRSLEGLIGKGGTLLGVAVGIAASLYALRYVRTIAGLISRWIQGDT